MKVKFIPLNIELEIAPSQSVMDLAHKNGIEIKSVCNGMPSCAECRVKVTDGDWNVLPPSSKELNLIGTGHFIDQRRLSCQLICFGDITVDVSEQLEKAGEDLVTKKFLNRAQKESAEDSHSVGGILIEQEQEILKEVSLSAEAQSALAKNEDVNPQGILPQAKEQPQEKRFVPKDNNQQRQDSHSHRRRSHNHNRRRR